MISFLRLALYLHMLLHGVDSLELWSKQKLQYNTKSKPSGCLGVAKDGDEVRIEWSVSDADSKEKYNEGTLSFAIGGENTIGAMSQGLMGACVGEVRTILFPNQEDLGYSGDRGHVLYPLLGEEAMGDGIRDDAVKWLFAEVTLKQITEPVDFELFKHINDGEINRALKSLESPTMDIGMVDSTGQTPLMAAIAVQMVQVYAMILNSQPRNMSPAAYVNIAKSTGHTALFYAVNQPDPALVKALLKKGAEPNARLVNGGWTAMHFAAMLGNGDHLKIMLDFGGDPYSTTEDGRTIMDVLDLGDPELVTTHFKNKVMNMLNDAIDDLDEQGESALGAPGDEL
ncbi:hypothetical protein TrVE_jg11766 [Triparma verrucosa]|uniref:peptidylprolyl isomerase n=1 Tax=Triparma verrucosa TaxID=1606542 RepID=A0A9W7F168_9STRA|nr:hypothetical protein TrVE_jg11766 [Triparma verrucosa]